jgi:hypothetical protein
MTWFLLKGGILPPLLPQIAPRFGIVTLVQVGTATARHAMAAWSPARQSGGVHATDPGLPPDIPLGEELVPSDRAKWQAGYKDTEREDDQCKPDNPGMQQPAPMQPCISYVLPFTSHGGLSYCML